MKVSGFTIIRNAVKYDFPVVEAISSVLPLCDEFIVAVGDCEDGTLELIKSINSPKIKIVHTVWEEEKYRSKHLQILAVETDKAFKAISPDSDWAFYIQSDEALHEKYLDATYKAMQQWKDDEKVEGLLFNYKHFYGSYDYVGASPRWYRREVRIVRNRKNIFSYKDAQGFRKLPNEKLNVKLIDAEIYHYGYVRDPKKMAEKMNFNQAMHNDDPSKMMTFFNYDEVDALNRFDGTHPAVMQDCINRMNWEFDFDPSFNKMRLKDKFKLFTEKLTGKRIGEYRNYKIV
ncbi:MAG: glycosyltransferase family 2 protein [Bacteroidetes bacterium]|nr:glycosyltransferase family 2 protein [Bacteroidota bacterium]